MDSKLCIHPSFLDSKCTWCNKSVVECGNPATTPFRYIHPDLTLSLDEIKRIRDDNLQHLLGRKKLHLVLDLDHTLVHARVTEAISFKEWLSIISKEINDVYTIFDGSHVVKLRPGVREFITKVKSMFDLSIYTMGSRIYAEEVYRLLVSEAGLPRCTWVIAREDCVKEGQKRLDVLLTHKQVILILDDTRKVWEESCRENLVNIDRYHFFPIKEGAEVDTELDRVYRILMQMHTEFYCDDDIELLYGEECDPKDARDVLGAVMYDEVNFESRQRRLSGDEGSMVMCSRKRARDEGDTMSSALLQHHSCGQPTAKNSRTCALEV